MKKNNLINTLSPAQQYTIRRWFTISLFLISVTIIIVIALEIPQLHALQNIKKENKRLNRQTESFNQIMDQQNKLQQQEEECRKKQETITQYEHELSNLIDNLAVIMQASASICAIESLQFKNNHIELTAQCSETAHAAHFIEKLTESKQFHNLKLTSLQQGQKSLISFAVQGKL